MILIHNDGKEKDQSFEASVDVRGSYTSAYGATREEAIQNLKVEVALLRKELDEINYEEATMIDCMGRPLTSGAV